MSNILSTEQREQFIRDGYVVVKGLVPAEIVTATRENLCRAMKMSLTDPATWPEHDRWVPTDVADLTNDCRTEAMDDAATELVGDFLLRGQCISSVLDQEGKPPYIKGFLPVMAFPRPGEKRFDAENHTAGFHLDGIHFTTLWPDKILLIAMVYLHDTESYGGATVIRPGSHRQIFEYWQLRGESPHYNEMIPKDIEFALPLAMEGKEGDVIFMHHLAVHSGSPNHDDKVRLALNANFTSIPEETYEVKSGPPQEDWTPLDWTLRTDNIPVAAKN